MDKAIPDGRRLHRLFSNRHLQAQHRTSKFWTLQRCQKISRRRRRATHWHSNTGEPVAEETHFAGIRVVMHRIMHRRRPANRSYVKSLVRSAVFCTTWSMVHRRGNLSGRHRNGESGDQ